MTRNEPSMKVAVFISKREWQLVREHISKHGGFGGFVRDLLEGFDGDGVGKDEIANKIAKLRAAASERDGVGKLRRPKVAISKRKAAQLKSLMKNLGIPRAWRGYYIAEIISLQLSRA